MAQDNDEWPGREPDYEGSSTRGLMKALIKLGLVSDYQWAKDAETLVANILARGPILAGTNWHRDMFTPDREGFLHPEGPVDGGHEWIAHGANRNKPCPDGSKGACRMMNSWGPKWNGDGHGWLSFKDLDFLIKSRGEAVTATEIKKWK